MVKYESEIEIVEGTFGKDVNLQAQDKEGNGVDLTGCTVTFKVWKEGETSSRLSETCTPVDLTVGKVKYTLQQTDWSPSKLEAREKYNASLVAAKAGYQEEFINLTIVTAKKAPP